MIADFGDNLPDTLLVATRSATLGVMAKTVRTKLLGQVLHRRTGTLIRSITASPRIVKQSDSVMFGTFGTHLDYGKYHEQGFQGDVVRKAAQVRAHTRKEHTRADGTEVRQAAVKAHSRREHTATLNITGKKYMEGTLDEERNNIRMRFDRAITILLTTGKAPKLADLRISE